MRLGVSVKIFLAYAALLGAFGATSIFTLVYLHRARDQVLASQNFVEMQTHVDAAWRSLTELSPRERARRNDLNYAILFQVARQDLGRVLSVTADYVQREGSEARRAEIEGYREKIGNIEGRVVALNATLGTFLAAPVDSDVGRNFLADLARLGADLNGVRKSLHAKTTQITLQLATEEDRAVDAALALGGVGLLAAIGAGLFMLRTLRPLGVLRQHARQIAGGDYGRRVGLQSQDEIGDLAREFDGMAEAIQERQQRLIRSERLAAVGRMAAQITHEIRNPLASIALYVELLGDELDAQDSEGQRLAAGISKEIDRLSEITESYLRFVRLPKPKREREDLGAMVANVLEFARAELSSAGVGLELSIAAPLPDVAADENQIRQVLLNLARNAREAMPNGGTLRVDVSPSGPEHVRLTMSDSGSGIAPEHLAKIFDPFFSTKDKGTGLGLALVQEIVAEHGGRIEVLTPAGGGTTFAITLPVAVAPQGLAIALAAGARATEV